MKGVVTLFFSTLLFISCSSIGTTFLMMNGSIHGKISFYMYLSNDLVKKIIQNV